MVSYSTVKAVSEHRRNCWYIAFHEPQSSTTQCVECPMGSNLLGICRGLGIRTPNAVIHSTNANHSRQHKGGIHTEIGTHYQSCCNIVAINSKLYIILNVFRTRIVMGGQFIWWRIYSPIKVTSPFWIKWCTVNSLKCFTFMIRCKSSHYRIIHLLKKMRNMTF